MRNLQLKSHFPKAALNSPLYPQKIPIHFLYLVHIGKNSKSRVERRYGKLSINNSADHFRSLVPQINPPIWNTILVGGSSYFKNPLFETIDQFCTISTTSSKSSNPFKNHFRWTISLAVLPILVLGASSYSFEVSVSRAARDQNQINPHQ